jgi:branched-chain amino acid transport system substrate-binding protein
MRARHLVAALAVGLLGLAAGCGGESAAPIRIGVLSDCYGGFSSAHEVILGASQLPLLARGGKLRGTKPSEGVEGARVAGRPVELVVGCAGANEDVIPEARRLVEEDGAQAIVGTLTPETGLVLRTYARRRPETAFVIQPSDAAELTLTDPAQNIFRFTGDAAQSVAGLGGYAYHQLGWRTAATIAEDVPYGWENVSGFVAEFCALGGQVVERLWVPGGTDFAGAVRRVPPVADGVYLGTALSPVSGFLRRYAAGHRDLAGRLVANETVLADPQALPLARGVVVAGGAPLEPTARGRAYFSAFAKAFPAISGTADLGVLALPYEVGVEAVLEALQRTDGATGPALMRALAGLVLDSPTGRIRLDRARQAVAPSYLSRVSVDRKGKPAFETLRVVPDVEQTFGGYFKPTDPPRTRSSPVCRRGVPPRWAR